MVNSEKRRIEECERFLESLELVRLPEEVQTEMGALLRAMPADVRGHVPECGNCAMAIEDFVDTRNLLVLAARNASVIKPGPWFSTKVMNAIAGKEKEMEERDGVWQNIMKLAPRLAAISALVLMLAGTWAVQTQKNVEARQMRQPGESLFEPAGPPALDDDVMISRGTR
jgi:hypothetical protein